MVNRRALVLAITAWSGMVTAQTTNYVYDTTTNSTSTSSNTNLNTSNSTSVNTNTNYNYGDVTNRNISTSTVNSTTSSTDNSTINQTVNSTSASTNVNTNVNQSVSDSKSFSESVNTQTVNQNVNGTPVPTAVAPGMMSYSQDMCSAAVSGAVQTQILGVSIGKTLRDENCERLKLGKTLYDMGMRVAAVSILCQDARVFIAMEQAGTPCPYEGKIGKEATAAWAANPKERPDKGKK